MLKMIDPDQALDLVLVNAHRLPSSLVPLDQAVGLTLGQIIRADRDYPPFARAMMDGFAVLTGDAGQWVEEAGEAVAGDPPELEITPGRCVAIMTGAPCPPGTEAVVPVEDVRQEGGRVLLPETITAGHHIAEQGSEAPKGKTLLQEGSPITPLALGVLASVGRLQVQGIDLPRLAIITTGHELVPLSRKPGPFQIRDSNGPMLAALVRQAGLPDPLVLHADDTEESLVQALSRTADNHIVLLSGGVSMGRYDLVPGALERHGAMIVFHKVSQKPGKPLLFATREEQLIFGLPGNPLSCHFCFHRYVDPAARKLAARPPGPTFQPGRLSAPLEVQVRRHLFVLARAEAGNGHVEITPLLGQGSADLFATTAANAYLRLPPGLHQLPKGEAISFQRIGY